MFDEPSTIEARQIRGNGKSERERKREIERVRNDVQKETRRDAFPALERFDFVRIFVLNGARQPGRRKST